VILCAELHVCAHNTANPAQRSHAPKPTSAPLQGRHAVTRQYPAAHTRPNYARAQAHALSHAKPTQQPHRRAGIPANANAAARSGKPATDARKPTNTSSLHKIYYGFVCFLLLFVFCCFCWSIPFVCVCTSRFYLELTICMSCLRCAELCIHTHMSTQYTHTATNTLHLCTIAGKYSSKFSQHDFPGGGSASVTICCEAALFLCAQTYELSCECIASILQTGCLVHKSVQTLTKIKAIVPFNRVYVSSARYKEQVLIHSLFGVIV